MWIKEETVITMVVLDTLLEIVKRGRKLEYRENQNNGQNSNLNGNENLIVLDYILEIKQVCNTQQNNRQYAMVYLNSDIL